MMTVMIAPAIKITERNVSFVTDTVDIVHPDGPISAPIRCAWFDGDPALRTSKTQDRVPN